MNPPPDKPLETGERRRRRRRSHAVPAAVAAPVRQGSDGPDQVVLQRLIITGWIVVLSNFPSGMLHAAVGNLVYARDLALAVHLFCSLGWLIKNRQAGPLLRRSWVVLIPVVMLIPASLNAFYTVEALRIWKWSFYWLDWVFLGYFARINRTWGDEFRLLGWLTLVMMVAELLAGVYEWVSGNYLFSTVWGSRTAFGVISGWDQSMDGHIRIRGLQRDVFSFSNLMAMNAVAGMAFLTVTRKAAYQLGTMVWIIVYTAMMVVSGGRASIFGVLAAGIYTVGIGVWPRLTARFERRYVLLWIGIAITLSLVGVGKFTDFVGNTLLGGSYVGDAESAFMRDDYWTKMLADFVHEPVILFIGGPFSSLFDTRVEAIFHWADNQLLWNVYHLGLPGTVAAAYLFYKVLQPETQDDRQRKVRQALVLFLVSLIGEGIARESLTYIGCLPLFLLCGYECATESLSRGAGMTASPLRRLSRRASGGAG